MTPADRLHRVCARLAARLPKPLHDMVPVDHGDSQAVLARRRRTVLGVSACGAGLLGVSLAQPPGSAPFYAWSLSLAGTWVAGSIFSGPIHRGWIQSRDERLRRPVVAPLLTGAGAFGLFYGAAWVVRGIPGLGPAVAGVLSYVDQGTAPLVMFTACANGLAEEFFFRGALYDAMGERHPVAKSTAIYTLATVPTRNPALVLAAAPMGTLFALQRRASGGIQASALTHMTWSVLMLRYLPPLFRECAHR